MTPWSQTMFQRPVCPRDQLKPAIVTIMTIVSFTRAGNDLSSFGNRWGRLLLTNEVDCSEIVVTNSLYNTFSDRRYPCYSYCGDTPGKDANMSAAKEHIRVLYPLAVLVDGQ